MRGLHHGLYATEWTNDDYDNDMWEAYRIGSPSIQIIQEEAGAEGGRSLGETAGCRLLGCGVWRFKEQWA